MAAESFVGVRVAGGLLPAELLSRIAAGGLAGQASADYHLAPGETVRAAANRAWAYLTGVWATYRQAADKLPESDRGTTLTRERWLLILLRELGYGRVPTTPAGGLSADGKQLPVFHAWEHVPMHLLGHVGQREVQRERPGQRGRLVQRQLVDQCGRGVRVLPDQAADPLHHREHVRTRLTDQGLPQQVAQPADVLAQLG